MLKIGECLFFSRSSSFTIIETIHKLELNVSSQPAYNAYLNSNADNTVKRSSRSIIQVTQRKFYVFCSAQDKSYNTRGLISKSEPSLREQRFALLLLQTSKSTLRTSAIILSAFHCNVEEKKFKYFDI